MAVGVSYKGGHSMVSMLYILPYFVNYTWIDPKKVDALHFVTC